MQHIPKHTIIIGLLVLTALAITFERPVELDTDPGIRTELPRHIGSYQGERILFCQNPSCLHSFRESELADQNTCPKCKGTLHMVSLAEKQILPCDTLLEKMMYSKPGGANLFVSIVVSGAEQRSIHRPQQCLPAQGLTISRSEIISVNAIPGRAPLRVMLLRTHKVGDLSQRQGTFAYWFVGGGYETPYHIERLLLNARARICNRRAPRWAYISISLDSQSFRDSDETALKQFIRALAPMLDTTTSDIPGRT